MAALPGIELHHKGKRGLYHAETVIHIRREQEGRYAEHHRDPEGRGH